MKAVIMAGGEGSRLRPLTCGRPKPMVPIVNVPMMEHIIELLKSHGMTEILATLHYRPEEIMDYFRDGSDFGVNIEYFIEETPLGTAGSVKQLQDRLDGTFLVISGDALTDIDLTKLAGFHHRSGAVATLALTRVDNPLQYGVVVTAPDGRIRYFLEKPGPGEVFSDTVNTGIYVLEPRILDYLGAGQFYDFSKNLFPLLLSDNQPMYGFVAEGYWCDVGDLQQYRQAQIDVLDGKVKVKIPGQGREGVFLEPGADVSSRAEVYPPVVIGEGSRISPGCKIGPYVVVGRNVHIGSSTTVKRSVIWDRTTIGRGVEVRGAILSVRTRLGDRVSLFEDSVVGDSVSVGEKVTIKPGVKVWPEKVIDEGVVLHNNVVWGSQCPRNIFRYNALVGVPNLEITPEQAVQVGAAFGTSLKEGSKVVLGSVAGPTGEMVKSALKAGLASSGVDILELGTRPAPVTRHALSHSGSSAGCHISFGRRNQVTVRFYSEKGLLLGKESERKLETLIRREEYRRAQPERMGRVSYFPGANESYLQYLFSELDNDAVRRRRFTLVAGYSAENGLILTELLTRLGCQIMEWDRVEVEANQEPTEALQRLHHTVREEGGDFGFLTDPPGERLWLVDAAGQIVHQNLFQGIVATMVLEANGPGATVVLPVTASGAIEDLIKAKGGNVLRSRAGSGSFMEACFAADSANARGPSQLAMYFEAPASLANLLIFLSRQGITLTQLLSAMPSINMVVRSVDCPWEKKGTVLRNLIDERSDGDIELVEGMRVKHQDGWALVLPDPDHPRYHVFGEGNDMEIAESLADFYVDRIEEIKNRSNKASSSV